MLKFFATVGILALGIGIYAAIGGWAIVLITGVVVGLILKS